MSSLPRPIAAAAALALPFLIPALAKPNETSAGALMRIDRTGPQEPCPLKHTAVKATISGFLARVTVTQEFENPAKDRIEAVYVFPLPARSAVDDMTIYIGQRTVRGRIKRREEARKIYEAAKSKGQLAGLLDQERPNIFTQSVANIPPGEKVKVVISYVETLKYEAGNYEFSFPMVVGPRYIPGAPAGRQAGGWAPDTDRVPDASKITPPVARPGARAGHDISIEVSVDAGMPIDGIAAPSHEIDTERPSPRQAVVRLRQKAVIPNKDFVLRYDVAGRQIANAVLAHRGAASGFFTLILNPPERVAPAEATPKELVFVLDTSGSMSGFPIEKAKEVIDLAFNGMNPRDTFNLITFAGDTHVLFPHPVPATPENLGQARAFLRSRSGRGGTEMMKAIRAALDPTDEQGHVRVVCFLTDGYVGNDMEIIGEVKKHPNTRVFSFGIGGSVNRFLLDKMAEEGRGEVEYVALNEDGSAAARRFHERVRSPLLTDISIEWGGLKVADVYPKRIPDLFSARPLIVHGRYSQPARGVIRLRGRTAAGEFVREIAMDLPAKEPRHDVLASLWARTRVDDLMSQDWAGMQSGSPRPGIREEITQLGLDYRLMTQFTSFVAVEETVVTEGGQPRRIEVPVEMPEGVSYEGVFGDARQEVAAAKGVLFMMPPAPGALEVGSARIATDRADRSARMAVREKDTRAPAKPPMQLSSKLHLEIQALVERLKRTGGYLPPMHELSFVRDGQAFVKVTLASGSAAEIEELKKLGLEITSRSGAVLSGKIGLQKLAALAESKSIRYLEPSGTL